MNDRIPQPPPSPATSRRVFATSARLIAAVAGLAALFACDLTDADGADDARSTADAGTPATGEGLPAASAAWTSTTSPCTGNRTNALHVADGGALVLVGCGENTDGEGIFRSRDGGATFTTVPGTERFRANDLRPSDDGWLYAGGTSTAGPVRALRIADGGRGDTIEPVLEAGSQVGSSFTVGRFVRLAGGGAFAESLTGIDIACRPSDGSAWTFPGSSWVAEGGGDASQMLDVTVHAGRIWASGSRINEPPTLFRARDVGAEGPCSFDRWEVSPGEAAEAWGIAVVSDEEVVLGGYSSPAGRGYLWTAHDGAFSEPSSWTRHDVNALLAEGGTPPTTWIRDVCTNGAAVVAVGERQPLRRGGAIALLSADAGRTWRVISPPDGPSTLTVCSVADDGTVTVAGSGGWVGTYR